MEERPSTGLFASAEVGHSIEKPEYEEQLSQLRVDLLNLQYDCRTADFSTILLIVGDDRPGCVDLLHTLHEWMDARYMESHVLYDDFTEEETERPWAFRYWRRLPPKGRTGLFLGAWPVQLIQAYTAAGWDDRVLDVGLEHIERFERELAANGTLLLKFWLHLPKDVLAERLKKSRKDKKKNKSNRHWRVEERDWGILEKYDEGLPVLEKVVRQTSSVSAPWNIVESTDHRFRNLTVGKQIARALQARLDSGPPKPSTGAVAAGGELPDGQGVLDQVDLSSSLDEDVYDKELDRLQSRLAEVSREAYARDISWVAAFEGWDAAGKGGCIRRVTRALPVQALRVIPIAAPTDEELARHYLWRFWRHLPRAGHTVIFDRSWYGRVLVERVEGFATEHQWRRSYDEINDFEALLHEAGTPVLKFWLHIDPEEQLKRFEARAQTPYKKYKLTDEDYRNREKTPLYVQAVHDMVTNTSTSYAPWHLIPANDKRFARIEVLRTVCEQLERRLADEPRRKTGRKEGKKGKGRKGKKREKS